MRLAIGESPAATELLGAAELGGLKATWIRTRADLNEAEQAGIVEALRRTRAPALDQLLDDRWLRMLHGRMLGDVWSWAGRYRVHQRETGIDPADIAVEMRILVTIARVWLERDEPIVVVARLHHRLQAIQPFTGANARHARIVAEYLAGVLDVAPLSWGRSRGDADAARPAYLAALSAADKGDLGGLAEFIGS